MIETRVAQMRLASKRVSSSTSVPGTRSLHSLDGDIPVSVIVDAKLGSNDSGGDYLLDSW